MNIGLKNITNKRKGSFGEFLVDFYYRQNNHKVIWQRKNNIDVWIDDIPYDVKITTNYPNSPIKNKPYPIYTGYHDVDVIYVNAYNDGSIIFSINGKLIHRFATEESFGLFSMWKESRKIRIKSNITAKPINKDFIENIIKEITAICKTHNKSPRFIYRNGIQTQIQYGKFGPKNLIPTKENISKYDITIILWTENYNKIHKIIAFNHSDIDRLPLYKHSVGFNKDFLTLNLNKFPKEFSFDSIEDFENRFSF